MHAGFMRLEGNQAIFGEDALVQKFPSNFRGLFVAEDQDAVHALADRCFGPFVSDRGSFTFVRDNAHQWLQKVPVDHRPHRTKAIRFAWR